MTIKVSLRTKVISKNMHSLYLDFYPSILNPKTGNATRREFLGLYLIDKPKNNIDKQHNLDTKSIAESIRQQRENKLNKPEIYSDFEKDQLIIKEKGQMSFLNYFKQLSDKRKASNHDNWVSANHYLTEFADGDINFSDLNENFCEKFKSFLLNSPSNRSSKKVLTQNSAVSYFNKFKAALKEAYKDGYLQTDLNSKIGFIKQAETHRNFLTIEELNKLANTDCVLPVLKNAALFSALTGLRFSDIKNLVWGEIEFIEGQGYFLNFTQQKTKGIEVMPISKDAFNLLGEPKEKNEIIFQGLVYSGYTNSLLFKWLVNAGISKNITFHCFRHTYATLQLSGGTDIYTVSKMLGHRDLKTTQIYAKIVDETKRATTNKIKLNI
jgi:integrase